MIRKKRGNRAKTFKRKRVAGAVKMTARRREETIGRRKLFSSALRRQRERPREERIEKHPRLGTCRNPACTNVVGFIGPPSCHAYISTTTFDCCTPANGGVDVVASDGIVGVKLHGQLQMRHRNWIIAARDTAQEAANCDIPCRVNDISCHDGFCITGV